MQKVVRPLLLGAPPISDAVIDAAKAAASACLSYLERFFTSIAPEQSFLVAGDKPTVADLQLVAELDQVLPEAHDLVDFTPYPAVLAWIARVRSAVPAHATVFQPVLDAAAARKAAAAAAAK